MPARNRRSDVEEIAPHRLAVGRHAGEKFEGAHGLADRHARAVDDAANIGVATSVAFDVGPQACPCSIFGAGVTGTEANDTDAVPSRPAFQRAS